MENLIPVNIEDAAKGSVTAVSAWHIYDHLEISRRFSVWIEEQIKRADLIEKADYIRVTNSDDNSYLKVRNSGRGRSVEIDYFLSLDAAKEICMMSRTPKGKQVRRYFIEVEKKCKLLLRRQANADWMLVRSKGKMIRIEQTHVIKEFVDYAIAQGSKSADKYYMTLTKMENKALFILEEGLGKPSNLRDMLSAFQVSQVTIADRIVAKALREGMDAQMYYKDIYQMARGRIEEFAELVGKTTVIDDSNGLIGHNSQHALLIEGAPA